MILNYTKHFDNHSNTTLIAIETNVTKRIPPEDVDTWKYYLGILNVLISISFVCDCILLMFISFNLARHVCCLLKIKKKDNSEKSDKKNICILNYVTIAFIYHQALVDLLRMVYFLLYINNLKLREWQRNNENELMTMNTFLNNNNLLSKYCFQIATFYSILTMVTLINILAIFISETCRFYDLKLDSNDSSNICCVLFGILLIWLSSLIIISSIMLIGISSSAAPNHCHDYTKNESPDYSQSQFTKYQEYIATTTMTRTFVINFVWLIVIFVVMSIVIFYSRSLFKELNSLNYRHHRISIYALYHPNRSTSFQQRHFLIVKQTSRRLVVLFTLIIIFCLTWFPNFSIIIINTFLKDFSSLNRAASHFCSIFWLMNPCFNSFIFAYFVIKENSEHYELNLYDDEDGGKCTKLNNIFLFIVRKLRIFKKTSISSFDDSNKNNETAELQAFRSTREFEEFHLKIGEMRDKNDDFEK